MFDKHSLIQRLEELSFPKKEYWVIAGGAMVLHGLRPQTQDIDLGCSTLLADKLEQQGYLVSHYDDGTRKILYSENIEIFENWIEGTVDIISGVPVVCVDGLIQMKRKLGRKKDLADIALIEKVRGTIMIREITDQDYEGLMKLYMQLHGNALPEKTEEMKALWERILTDRDHHIIVAEEDGKIVSSCVCVIIPNLTHNQQPYAFIENVITDEAYRKKGFATACLNYAKEIALKENCYKMMLLTGSKEESTLRFYERAGYNRKDKTAFIQWL